MDVARLINTMQVVDLSATTRIEAVRELVEAIDWPASRIPTDRVIEALEQRESAARTIVAEGLGLPHAIIDWEGDFAAVLGRSRTGIDYGSTGKHVHLVILLLFGSRGAKSHLEILAMVAEVFRGAEFREALVQAPDMPCMHQLLRERCGIIDEGAADAAVPVSPLGVVLLETAVQLARKLNAQALLIAVDRLEEVPWEPVGLFPGRLLIVTAGKTEEPEIDRTETYWFQVPHTGLSRMDRASLGLLLATSKGLVDDQADVVCVTGPGGPRLDSITVTKPAVHLRAVFDRPHGRRGRRTAPAVLLRILSLAIELASEGREGKPIGTLFVIGDADRVMKCSQQLVLNPFHGYSRRMRNVLDASLTETLKEFALLDGAFVIKEDGTVLSTGRYLAPPVSASELPGGLGTRHQAAAGITVHTRSIAVTVSQSTGTVSVFQNGSIVLALQRASLTRW